MINRLFLYVGDHNTKKEGITTVRIHHSLFFGNTVEKVIHVEKLKHLSIHFRSCGRPNSHCLLLEEIHRLDYRKTDFSGIIDE